MLREKSLNVLKSINFNKYKPKLVSIEIHNMNNFYLDDNKYFKKERVYKYLINKKL
jgi:hypothetical protein